MGHTQQGVLRRERRRVSISPGAEVLLQQQAQLRVLLPQVGCFSEELGPVLKDLAAHGG